MMIKDYSKKYRMPYNQLVANLAGILLLVNIQCVRRMRSNNQDNDTDHEFQCEARPKGSTRRQNCKRCSASAGILPKASIAATSEATKAARRYPSRAAEFHLSSATESSMELAALVSDREIQSAGLSGQLRAIRVTSVAITSLFPLDSYLLRFRQRAV